jgi:hypothetical protein
MGRQMKKMKKTEDNAPVLDDDIDEDMLENDNDDDDDDDDDHQSFQQCF